MSSVVTGALLLALALALIWVLIRMAARSRRDPLAYQFTAPRGKAMVIVFNAALIVVAAVMSSWFLNSIRAKVQDDVRFTLETVLRTTQQNMNFWVSRQKSRIEIMAHDPRVVEFSAWLATASTGQVRFDPSEALLAALAHTSDDSGHLGACILSPAGSCVVATGKEQSGQPHPITQHRPDLLRRVLAGESLLVPPLSAASTGMPTLYFAAPIRDAGGRVIAVLAEGSDATGDFTRIAQLGLIGRTGETYAFDRQGRMLTGSRFREKLAAAGAIGRDGTSILTLELRDPGGPLAQGFRPALPRAEQPLTRMAASAIRGEAGNDVAGYRDYRGEDVFGAWVWDRVLDFGLATEIDVDDAMAVYYDTRRAIVGILAAMIAVSIALTLLVFAIGSRTNRALRSARDQLEQRVSERTRELAQTNTELAGREEEMRSLSSLLNNVLASASEIAIVATAPDGIITIFNSGAERMFGYRAAEVVDKHTPEILHLPEELAARGQALSAESNRPILGFEVFVESIKRAGLEVSEWTFVHKDGRHFPGSLVVTTMRDAAGAVSGYLGIVQDITRPRAMMAEVAAARDAAHAANQAKSAFLATMSHEIRTPMNGILGSVEVLRRASLTPYQMELADVIGESAQRLLVIIDDVLDFSKIEAGRLEQEREPVDPAIVVESACVALQPVAVKKNVKLSVFVDPQLPRRVLADPLRLRQIVTNLVSNAIKFSGGGTEGGRVRIEAQRAGADRLRLTVQDNGIGMTPEVIAKLFVPFTQADVSTTRRFGGSGLGLSIVKRLSDMMGGEIAVQSAPGKGSAFTLTLPLESAAAQPSPDPDLDLTGLTVALAASDAAAARAWAACLEQAGAAVLLCADAETALIELDDPNRHEVVLLLEGESEALAQLSAGRPIPPPTVRIGGVEQRRPYREAPGVMHLGGVVTRDALTFAVAAAAGRVSPEPETLVELARARRVKAPTIDEAAAARRLILVAEDNDLNRKVIGGQLAALGHAAEFAEDGSQALERSRTGRYALLLTDLHMPGLDGYALTAAIRCEEGEGRRLPIVMLTANALRGEEARCLAAGMDAYLSKPVPLERLQAVLERWLPAASPHPAVETNVERAPALAQTAMAVLDPSVLARLLGSDEPALISEFLADFRVSAENGVGDIRAALQTQDWQEVGATAHKLKSSARSVGALALGDVCARLEKAGKDTNGDAIRALVPEFESALAAVTSALAQRDPEPADHA